MDGLNRLTMRAVFAPFGKLSKSLLNNEEPYRILPTKKIRYGDRLTSLLNIRFRTRYKHV